MPENELLHFALLALGGLAAILNPVGIIPQYIAFTAKLSTEEKKAATKRASLVACAILVIISIAGTLIFNFFGFTAPAFKIAGGGILFIIALNMLNLRQTSSLSSPEAQREALEKEDVSVFPLAFPLIAGPGSITTVLILSERTQSPADHFTLAASILVCVFFLYLVLARSGRISDKLGRIGMNVLTRLTGLIVASISVQFILDGIKEAFFN